jgi:hypothetical protein
MRRLYELILLLLLIVSLAACKRKQEANNNHFISELTRKTPSLNGNSGKLFFQPDKLPDAQIGKSYKQVIAVSGNVTPVDSIYIEGELPAGLVSASGIIEGIPTKEGTYRFSVIATCYGTQTAGQLGRKEYELEVR